MAKDKSHKDTVIAKLRRDGCVTRNWALQRYITRLAAVIHDLKQEGWRFRSHSVETENGKDHKYVVRKAPDPQGNLFGKQYKN